MVPRKHYLEKIRPFLDKPVVKILTGMRRVGKSTLLAQVRDGLLARGASPANIVSINKDLLEWDHVRTYRDLDAAVRSRIENRRGPRYIMVDEIQEIDGWERAINSFLAEGMADLIITGSNSHLLATELSTLLTGRFIEVPILPLGLAEFLEFRAASAEPAGTAEGAVESEFDLFLRYGGLPGIHVLSLVDEQMLPYLEAILNTILLKDVVRRHAIRDVSNLERIIAFVMDNIGNLVSARRIAAHFRNQSLSITTDTAVAYLNHLASAFLVHRVGRYGLKGRRHLEYQDKYYAGDVGLRHGLFGYREADRGGLLENIVYLELRRRGYSVHVGVIDDTEIDFVAERSSERLYIQVCYLLAGETTVEREFGNLERIEDNYPKLVLSLDRHFPEERQGIRHRYLPQFLLDADSHLGS